MYLFDLTGRVAVVTGGTRGIGLMMARGLLQAGASVYLSSRKPEAGQAAVDELSEFGRVVSVPADLSSEAECLRLAAEVGRPERASTSWSTTPAPTGAPPGGVPRARLGQGGRPQPQDAVLPGPGVPAAARGGRHRRRPGPGINVGSIDGLRVPYKYPTYSYSASKAGLHQLTRVLARELGPRHITVNAVAPGP